MKRKKYRDGIDTPGYKDPRVLKATLLDSFEIKYDDRTLVECKIWLVPATTVHPHGFKYRLHYGTTDGSCLVRYDNKTGKGDHRHIGLHQEKYVFTTIEKLLEDFWSDVDKAREGKL